MIDDELMRGWFKTFDVQRMIKTVFNERGRDVSESVDDVLQVVESERSEGSQGV